MADCFRAPVVTRLQAKPHLNSGFVHQSLLLTTLVAVAVSPFVQKSFDNPVTRRARQYEQVGVNTRLLSARPLNQFDWPNPVWRAKTAQDHSHSVLLSTLSLTIAAPFTQADWLNPVKRAKTAQDCIQGIPRTLLIPAAPVSQKDWQNPQRRASRTQDWSHSVLLSTLNRVDPRPFNKYDWPNPVLPDYARDIHFTYQNAQIPNVAIPYIPPIVVLPRNRVTRVQKVERTALAGKTNRNSLIRTKPRR